MTTFQVFERQLRLLNLDVPFTARTGQAVLYYLGELIAAQNYSLTRLRLRFSRRRLMAKGAPFRFSRSGAESPFQARLW